MKMVALVALKPLTYGKKNSAPGDTFQATPRDARILVALRRAQLDPAGVSKETAAPAKTASMREVVIDATRATESARRAPPTSYGPSVSPYRSTGSSVGSTGGNRSRRGAHQTPAETPITLPDQSMEQKAMPVESVEIKVGVGDRDA